MPSNVHYLLPAPEELARQNYWIINPNNPSQRFRGQPSFNNPPPNLKTREWKGQATQNKVQPQCCLQKSSTNCLDPVKEVELVLKPFPPGAVTGKRRKQCIWALQLESDKFCVLTYRHEESCFAIWRLDNNQDTQFIYRRAIRQQPKSREDEDDEYCESASASYSSTSSFPSLLELSTPRSSVASCRYSCVQASSITPWPSRESLQRHNIFIGPLQGCLDLCSALVCQGYPNESEDEPRSPLSSLHTYCVTCHLLPKMERTCSVVLRPKSYRAIADRREFILDAGNNTYCIVRRRTGGDILRFRCRDGTDSGSLALRIVDPRFVPSEDCDRDQPSPSSRINAKSQIQAPPESTGPASGQNLSGKSVFAESWSSSMALRLEELADSAVTTSFDAVEPDEQPGPAADLRSKNKLERGLDKDHSALDHKFRHETRSEGVSADSSFGPLSINGCLRLPQQILISGYSTEAQPERSQKSPNTPGKCSANQKDSDVLIQH
ncbi:hypothetical protein NA57DRAFT_56738 [Rhizodiscina lignyota]|uniref:Uncharacterized protein n=1 Tax=Rhizodiscina lignyota TaxID=1504668 RepID=A0A9P4M5X0_9PEZI|nr:hypothetical protein NA57DRAFT_56738 [Rhizodiscina lignyota]